MSPPRLALFGVPALRDAVGRGRPLRTRKQLGVLLYLALEGRDQSVSRDLLVDLLWDDVPPEHGRHSFAQACTAIRGALGPDALARVGDGVRLAISLETDLDHVSAEFDTLALAEPLLEADRWAGADFAHWVDRTRERLRRAANTALRDAIDGYRLSGDSMRVHACAAVLYQLDPLSDVAVQALAERELIRGDVVGAIRLLRAHLTRLQESLGCVPQVEVARLLRRLEAGAHPPVELLPARLAAEVPKLRPAVFVGRERELATLEGEWQQARRGGFRGCLVLGPGGIGKSSLVRRFAATVAARARPIFVITCQEIGQGIPFAAIADVVTALSRDPSVAGTDPKWLAEVSRIHPALRAVYPGIPEPPDAPPESIRLRLAEGLAQMLDAVADHGPVGIVFDDLQFMDPATRDVLHVLSRRIEKRGVLLVATVRTFGTEGGLAMSPPEIGPVSWTSTITLGPLSRYQVHRLVSVLAPRLLPEEQAVVNRITELSDGHPLFVELLLTDWEHHQSRSLASTNAEKLPEDWSPPESMRQAFARLYAGLPDLSQQILHVLAIARRSLGLDEVADSLNRSTRDLDDPLLQLIHRGVLRLDNGAICYKNELQRAYVYYAIGKHLRAIFHAKLARMLMTRTGTRLLQAGIEASQHLMKAGQWPQAADLVISTAPAVIRSRALAEVETVLRELLTVTHQAPVDARLRILLAEALSARSAYLESLELVGQVPADTDLPGEAAAMMEIVRAQALHRTGMAKGEETKEAVLRALQLAAVANAPSVLAAAVKEAAEVASELGDTGLLESVLNRGRALLDESRDDVTRARVLFTNAFCLMASGAFREAYEAFGECSRLLKLGGLDPDRARALNGQGICLLGLGQHSAAIQPFIEGLGVARELDDVHNASGLLSNLGVVFEDIGMFPEASRLYSRAAEQEHLRAIPRRVALTNVNVATISLVRGDFDQASKAIGVARRAAVHSQVRRLQALVDLTEADLCLSKGELELAWPLVQRATGWTAGRERSIDTNGRALRLLLHFVLSTEGFQRMVDVANGLSLPTKPLKLAERLEVLGFLYWACCQKRQPHALVGLGAAEIARTGLVGVIATLAAAGIDLDDSHHRYVGESGADFVERAYPRSGREIQLTLPDGIL